MNKILLFCLIALFASASDTYIDEFGNKINPTYEKIYSHYDNKEFDEVLNIALPLCKNNEIIPCKYTVASLIEKEKQCGQRCIEISKKVCDLGEIMDCDFYALYTKNLDKSREICDNATKIVINLIKERGTYDGREDKGFCAFVGNLYQQNKDYRNAVKYYAISCELFSDWGSACVLLEESKNEMSYYYEDFVNSCKTDPDMVGCKAYKNFHNQEEQF